MPSLTDFWRNSLTCSRGNPHQTFNIINLDDAMFGTSGIVQRTVEDRKRRYIVPGFALDKEGVILKAWGLVQDSSAVISSSIKLEK